MGILASLLSLSLSGCHEVYRPPLPCAPAMRYSAATGPEQQSQVTID